MSTMQCKVCGGEIDNTSATCPSCGATIALDEQTGQEDSESSFNAQQERIERKLAERRAQQAKIDVAFGEEQDRLEGKKEQHLELIQKAKKYSVCISAGEYHTVCLKTDGTVVATGYNTKEKSYYDYDEEKRDMFGKIIPRSDSDRADKLVVEEVHSGQCDTKGWSNIIAVAAGETHTVGLTASGSVVAKGDNNKGQCNVSGWSDIVAVSAGTWHTVGLKANGTVVLAGDKSDMSSIGSWRDIVAVDAGSWHTVGLKADGTVVAVGNNNNGECNTNDWRDIVAVSAGSKHTVGLKADGTVVAVGDKSYANEIIDWSDIVAVDAGWNIVGLKADGTVVSTGRSASSNTEDLRDIVAVSSGFVYTIALKSDGTVVAVGGQKEYEYGQGNVSGWKDIGPVSEEQRISMIPKAKRQTIVRRLLKKLLVVGIICALGLGGYFFYRWADSKRLDEIKKEELCTASVTGSVVDYEVIKPSKKDRDKGYTDYEYYPVFSYTINGTKYRHKSATSSSDMRFKVGAKVTVRYDPKNINTFYIAEDKADRSSWISVIIRNTFFILIGLYALWYFFLKKE